MPEPVAVPSVITTSSRLLAVLESLIGPVPYGLAALARWQHSNGHRPGFFASVLSPRAFRRVPFGTKPHIGCIAVRDHHLHFFDFGCQEGEVLIREGRLYDLLRHGVTPSVVSTPLSALVIKKSRAESSTAVLVTGALELYVYPGIGGDFPASLWTALSPVE